MGDIWSTISEGMPIILVPARLLMETFGLHPTDIQVWALMVVVFMLVWLGPTTFGDLVLLRRQRRTTGTVVSHDESGDMTSPRIGFHDHTGRYYEFDSPLSLNARTSIIGSDVEVVYDPIHPQRAREANRPVQRILLVVMWYGFAIWLAIYAVLGDDWMAG